jgi:hypothetical protein
MIYGLHYADACGRGSYRNRCTYLMEVGWGVVHEYTPVVEQDLLPRWMRGEIALGWNIAKGGIVQLKRCGYVMDRRFQTVGWPDGMVVWAGEVVKARVGVEEPHIPMKMTAGDRMAPGGLESQVSYRWDFAPEIVKGTLWAV